MTSRRSRSQGVLSRAARGEGIICPHCKTFAPMMPGGKARCPSCGGDIEIEALEPSPGAGRSKVVPKAPTRTPSGHLGTERSQ